MNDERRPARNAAADTTPGGDPSSARGRKPTAEELLERPHGLLNRSHLAELGLGRRAVDAVFQELHVVSLPRHPEAAYPRGGLPRLIERSRFRRAGEVKLAENELLVVTVEEIADVLDVDMRAGQLYLAPRTVSPAAFERHLEEAARDEARLRRRVALDGYDRHLLDRLAGHLKSLWLLVEPTAAELYQAGTDVDDAIESVWERGDRLRELLGMEAR